MIFSHLYYREKNNYLYFIEESFFLVFFSIQHIIVDETGVIVDYAYKHDFIPVDILTMWEIFVPFGKSRTHEHKYIHVDVNGVKGLERKGCCIRFLISCFR